MDSSSDRRLSRQRNNIDIFSFLQEDLSFITFKEPEETGLLLAIFLAPDEKSQIAAERLSEIIRSRKEQL